MKKLDDAVEFVEQARLAGGAPWVIVGMEQIDSDLVLMWANPTSRSVCVTDQDPLEIANASPWERSFCINTWFICIILLYGAYAISLPSPIA